MCSSLINSIAHPRLQVAHLPTPLEPMRRLSAAMGGPTCFVKRDDCTGLATGGNKTRKLEFLLGEAVRQEADVVLTAGGTQSNHVRQTAALSSALGMRCVAFLEHVPARNDDLFLTSGNLLLDKIFGVEVREVPAGESADALTAAAENEASCGNRPFVVPTGGSNDLGALGYVECAEEILEQAAALRIGVDWIVTASSSGGTHSGLLAGFEVSGASTRVLGVSVREPQQHVQEAKIEGLASATLVRLGHSPRTRFPDVVVDSEFLGPGYGIPTLECLEAIKMVARLESLLLDPVYTGKAMAALVGLSKEGFFSKDDVVVFLHTGGLPSLFAYGQDLGLA